jgi:uncharacterized protein (DUF362 family)
MSIVHIQKTANPRDISGLLERINPTIDSNHVFIKPNIFGPAKPSSAAVTDPVLVRGLIEYLRRRGIGRITIGEAPALLVDAEEAFRVSGYRKMAEECEVALVNLNVEETVQVPWALGRLQIPKVMVGAYYINAAKLKTHTNTTVSLGLKNQKGLIKDGFKRLIHLEGLHMPLVDLAKAVRPNLTIIDGVVGLEGDGPGSTGLRVRTGVLIVSQDVVAADAVGCRVMGIDPYQVQHIRLAAEAGLGSIDPEVEGNQISEVMHSFKRANEQYKRTLRFTYWRNPHACCMCGAGMMEAAKTVATNPRSVVTCGPKLAYGVLLGGIDVISGREAIIPEKHGKVICLGRCTEDFASRHGFVWVEGCPPQAKDIAEGFRKL